MSENPSRDIVNLANRNITKSNKSSPLSSPPSSFSPSPAGGSNNILQATQTNTATNNNTISNGDSHNNGGSISSSHGGTSHSINNLNNGQQQPVRRSSFGLNFLSSFTSSIRSNVGNQASGSTSVQQPPSPTENPHTFMSNSPTIANLNNYAISTNNDELNTTINEHSNNSISNTSGQGSSSSNSDFDHPTNVNNQPGTNKDIIEHASNNNDHNNTEVPSTQESQDLLDNSKSSNGMDKDGYFSVRLTPIIDHSSPSSGLYFSPVIRKIKPNSQISIGRYTEKNKAAAHAPQGSSAPIVFKSKVVSRTHALFQCNDDGQWFLKDCKSSSGTFLNHIRLSPASQESTMMPLIDGDIIQLGMDYRGGTEEVYRCVKMRCEFNKSWQRKVNQFNLEIHKKLQNLQVSNDDSTTTDPITGSSASKNELSECAICLLKLEPCQALFISPCSHSWHYKCIRPIIIKSYPQFYCPNCRSMCDLETDIEDEED